MNFLYACDDLYARYAGISITSLFENNRDIDEITVYVIANEVGEINRGKFSELSAKYGREIILLDSERIERYLDDKGLLTFGVEGRGTDGKRYAGRETYYRLFADIVLPEHVRRFVYLDCDVIILSNLSELENIIFEDNICSAMARSVFFRHYKEYIELDSEDSHFQAGVCVYDVDKWKLLGANRVSEVLRQKITYLRMHDMDILNLTVNANTMTLPVCYNVMAEWCIDEVDEMYRLSKIDERVFYSKDEVKAAIKNTKILHYCGEKPWVVDNTAGRCDEWEKYKLISPWNDIPYTVFYISFFRRCNRFIGRLLPKSFHNKIIETMHKYVCARYYKKHDHFTKLETYNDAVREMEGNISI